MALGYSATANTDDGSCVTKVQGCTDPTASDYDSSATIFMGCRYDVLGCTDSTKLDYSSYANLDDGSCRDYIAGCTIQGTSPYLSTTYNASATVYVSDSCVFVRHGCMDSTASNYDSDALHNDGSAAFACVPAIPGCIDPTADTYDSDATVSDTTSCSYPVWGCMVRRRSHCSNVFVTAPMPL